MKIIINKILVCLSLFSGLCSCSLMDVDPKVISKDNYYKSEAEIRYGLAGVYGAITSSSFYGSSYSIVYSNTDDLCYFNSKNNSSYLQYNLHTPGTKVIYNMWSIIYNGIKNANMFMEAIEASELDPQRRYYNEARFLRAYYHFILAQTWGNVPLRDKAIEEYADAPCAASSQYQVLKWCADEMESCVDFFDALYSANEKYEEEDLNAAPSRICRNTVRGILARLYLFMAGRTVVIEGEETKEDYYVLAMSHAKDIIDSGLHHLNPDYKQVFVNMIADKYDREYRESMWEADFLGDRSTAEYWSNGQIGQALGMKSAGNSTDYISFACNFAYGKYNGSLKLWDLYSKIDRTDGEVNPDGMTDERHIWNMPGYYYSDGKKVDYGSTAYAIRCCGKFRREVEYEGQKNFKSLYTSINYPILRYSDVLLMFAEASNEVLGLTSEAYECVKAVRDRAKVSTNDIGSYDQDTFRELVRNERGRELCFEGLRRYDLTRWGIYVKEMNDYARWVEDDRWKKSREEAFYAKEVGRVVKNKHIVLPIPSLELGVNSLLEQHPLW